MFIKRGGTEGKIISVIDESELTDEQKKAALDLSKKLTKQSEESDTSEVKKSGK